jgi:GNAT superfamily N-acetyltransferase
MPRLRPATSADLPRIWEVRHGTAENRLTDPSLDTDGEVTWYLNEAIFLVSENDAGVQGFACADHQTGYVWALFVIDDAQGRGHGTALLDEAIERLRQAGHRQAFLTTGVGTQAAAFYRSKGWRQTGLDMKAEAVFRLCAVLQFERTIFVAQRSRRRPETGRCPASGAGRIIAWTACGH